MITNRTITIVVEKENQNDRFWPRLQKASGKLAWVKTDFSRFVEDTFDDPEEDLSADPYSGGGMNEQLLQMMANQGGNAPGFGNMPLDDSDDDELPNPEEEEVPEETEESEKKE